MEILRELSRLTAARFPHHNHNIVIPAREDTKHREHQHTRWADTWAHKLSGRVCIYWSIWECHQDLMMLRSCWRTAKMGRYCLCSNRVFFLANSLLAWFFSFMWSANFCSALKTRKIRKRPMKNLQRIFFNLRADFVGKNCSFLWDEFKHAKICQAELGKLHAWYQIYKIYLHYHVKDFSCFWKKSPKV